MRRAQTRDHGAQQEVLPAALPLLGVALFFGPVLLGRRFFWGDFLYQYYPYHYFLFTSLRALVLPIWNPHIFAGMPFLGDVQSQVFHPLNWLLALVSSPEQRLSYWLVELKVILHIGAGGTFCYLLMRELGVSRAAALFAGLSFSLSGFVVGHALHVTLIMTYAWFPLLLLLFLRLQRTVETTARLRTAAVAGLVLGVAALSGHPQLMLQMIYVILALWILLWSTQFKASQHATHGSQFWAGLWPLFLVLGLGLGLSAVALIPAFEHATQTLREHLSYREATEGSLPLTFPMLLLVPKFFGSIAGDAVETVRFWGSTSRFDYWETLCYVGILPLLFALYAACYSSRRITRAMTVLAVLALVLSLGRNLPFYWFVFKFLPGFGFFRIPARSMGVFTLAIAVLAGFGFDDFLASSTDDRRRARFSRVPAWLLGGSVTVWLLFLVGAFRGLAPGLAVREQYQNAVTQIGIYCLFLAMGAAVFWCRARYSGGWLPKFCLGLLFVDLWVAGQRFNLGKLGPEGYYRRTSTVQRLQAEAAKEPFRINARSGDMSYLQANEGMIQRLELIEGFTPLALGDFVRFDIPPERKRDLLNARYRIRITDEARGAAILDTNATVLPRAWLAYDYVVVPDQQRALELLRQEDFDYRRVVILEREPTWRTPKAPLLSSCPDSNGVELLSRSNACMSWRVRTDRPGLLVVSEIYYPKWRATIDRRPAPVLRADHCLRALALDPGTHEIAFHYDLTSVFFSGGVSLAVFLLALVLLRGAACFRIQRRAFGWKRPTRRDRLSV